MLAPGKDPQVDSHDRSTPASPQRRPDPDSTAEWEQLKIKGTGARVRWSGWTPAIAPGHPSRAKGLSSGRPGLRETPSLMANLVELVLNAPSDGRQVDERGNRARG